jgi:hypothetical protein
MTAFLRRPKWQKTRFLKMQGIVILMLTGALAKIDDRFMTQIIFKMVGWKEEVVKSEGDLTKEGKIVQE